MKCCLFVKVLGLICVTGKPCAHRNKQSAKFLSWLLSMRAQYFLHCLASINFVNSLKHALSILLSNMYLPRKVLNRFEHFYIFLINITSQFAAVTQVLGARSSDFKLSIFYLCLVFFLHFNDVNFSLWTSVTVSDIIHRYFTSIASLNLYSL